MEWAWLLPFYFANKKSDVYIPFSFQTDIDEQGGLFSGLWESKVNDYLRLIKYSNKNKKTQNKILKLYDGTPCGAVMILTYKFFRKDKADLNNIFEP